MFAIFFTALAVSVTTQDNSCKRFIRLLYMRQRTVLVQTAYQSMYNDIVQSGIARKLLQKATHVNASTSKNTEACTIMSAESTDDTL